jgi:hypothetical protein
MTPTRGRLLGSMDSSLSLHGAYVRSIVATALIGIALSGCSSSSSPSRPTVTSSTAKGPAAVVVSPTHAELPMHVPLRRRPAIIAVDRRFAQAVQTLCAALTRKDAPAITRDLPYYQYNSGLRYGTLGDGEGQNGDPSLLATWLARAHVQCRFESSGSHGHGVVLATGWPQHGGTALIELDTYAGRWKINDFTFGPYGALYRALQTARPIVRFTP